MRTELDEMIDRFRSSQDRAVALLQNDLGLPLPDSGLAWSLYCNQNQLHGVNQLRGVPFYAHGYGVQVEIGGIKIDFDWGDDGQPDGFDGWRLWWHYSSNEWPELAKYSQINEWLAAAHSDGKLEKQGELYYDPSRRSSLQWGANNSEQSDENKSQ